MKDKEPNLPPWPPLRVVGRETPVESDTPRELPAITLPSAEEVEMRDSETDRTVFDRSTDNDAGLSLPPDPDDEPQ